MNSRKKLVSLIISLVLAVSFVNGSIDHKVYAAVDTDEIKENVTMLAALGIIEYDRFENYDYDAAMTRQEFAGVVGRMFALGESEGQSVFSDVPFGSENISYINKQYEMGIITGDESGKFNPYDTVRYDEAIVWIMRAAGYEDYLKETNDDGGLMLANKFGINSGVKYPSEKALTRGDAAYILKNTLDMPVFVQTGVLVGKSGEAFSKMEFNNNKTVLTERLKLSKIRGIVTADAHSDLNNSLGSPCAEDSIIIEGVTVEYDGGKDVLGMRVNAYLKEDNGIYSVVYLSEYGENETIRAAYNEFTLKDGVFTYWHGDNDKGKKEDILEGVSVIYNGKFAGKTGTAYISDSDFEIDSGNIMLIDNDSDGETDVIKLTEYKTVYVGDIEYDNKTIVDYFTNEAISFDDSAVDYSFVFDNGLNGAFEKIKVKNVLSVMESIDGKVCKVFVTKKTVKGVISAMDEDEVKIDKTYYPISRYRKELLASNNRFVTEFKYGANCIFYLNHEGELVTYDSVMSDYYGYVIGVGADGGVEKNVKIKVYTENGRFEIYELAENVSILSGGEKNKYKSENAVNLIDLYTVVRFELDKNNQIKAIEIAKPQSDGGDYLTKNLEKRKVEYHIGILGAQYCVNNQSVVFNVPDPALGIKETDNVGNYSIGNQFNADYKYTVDIYGADVYRTAKIVINYQEKPGGNLALGGSQLVVDGYYNALVGDDEKRVLKGWSANKEISCYIKDSSQTEYTGNANAAPWLIGSVGINELAFGDVLTYKRNSQNEIDKFIILHRASKNAEYAEKWSTTWDTLTAMSMRSELYTAYGQVDVVNDKQLMYILKDNTKKVVPFNGQTQFYLVDMEREKIEAVKSDAIRPGDNVFITVDYALLRTVYIYRW